VEQILDQGLRANAGTVFAGGLLYALVAHDLALVPKHLTDLFVYNYDRAYPDRETDPRQVFTILFYAAPAVALSPWLFDRLAQLWRLLKALPGKKGRAEMRAAWRERLSGAPLAAPEAAQDRSVVVLGLAGMAVAFAVYLGWFHWRALSPHWSQRDLFWIYYHQSQPDEPIGAYQMNWRGETFYSKNTVREIARNGPPTVSLADWLNGPGERKWVLAEQARIAPLRQSIGAGGRLKIIESRNIKFVLATVERESQPAPQQTPPPAPPQPPGQFGAPP
jgi:hypothetical protein